jgi:hypothetical protein
LALILIRIQILVQSVSGSATSCCSASCCSAKKQLCLMLLHLMLLGYNLFYPVLQSRSCSRWSSNFLLELEPKFFWPGSGSGAGYVNSYKMLQNPKFFILKLEVDFKNHIFVAIYLKAVLRIRTIFDRIRIRLLKTSGSGS